jgi:hypothetical protein
VYNTYKVIKGEVMTNPGEAPGIQPENLVVQSGENEGCISAEYIDGKVVEALPDTGRKVGDKVHVVDGLPRIGAEAEDKTRADGGVFSEATFADSDGVGAMDQEIRARGRKDGLKGVEPEYKAADFRHEQASHQSDREGYRPVKD